MNNQQKFSPMENKKYFSTFITGFETVVRDLLDKHLDKVKIDLLLDGLVIYTTTSSIEKVKKIRFLNNSFLLLRFFDKDKNIPLEKMIKQVLSEKVRIPVRLPSNWRTFRIITSQENQLVSVDKQLVVNLEENIRKNFGLKPNRSLPQVEFWFLSRREGFGFFGMRLTRHQDYAKSLQKGELRPELANFLCQISEPNNNDNFLDPFAGSGSIPVERAQNFSFKHILASDNNGVAVNKLKAKLRYLKLNLSVENANALHLDKINDGSIDKIVTDPPWGYFGEKIIDLPKFYTNMLDSFYRVLRKGGVAVLLVGERDSFENLLSKYQTKYTLDKKIYTLVSGKKAGVYKLIKN